MYTSEPLNTLFWSIPQQKILLLIFDTRKPINYKEQNIYKKERSFDNAMKRLCNAGLLRRIRTNDFYNEYALTLDGLCLVVDFLKHYIKENQNV